MKQFLVLKITSGMQTIADFIPMAGLLSREAAEAFVEAAQLNEPESTFLIQEVGAA